MITSMTRGTVNWIFQSNGYQTIVILDTIVGIRIDFIQLYWVPAFRLSTAISGCLYILAFRLNPDILVAKLVSRQQLKMH
jgi:hypothetical protein